METLLIQISKSELQEIIQNAVKAAIPHELSGNKPEEPIKGIHNLAAFLGVSAPRAQKLKNEGLFPYFQNGRLILFDPGKVRESWNHYSQNKKRE